MLIRVRNELLIINALVVLSVGIIIIFPLDILRIILGLPLVVFFPGYTLMAALFPGRKAIDGLERIALSIVLSIAIVALIGLALNFTPWGITLEPLLFSIAAFIFITSAIAWARRKRLAETERFGILFQLRLPGWGGSARDKAAYMVLVLAILGAVGMLGYVLATPKTEVEFTEFYVLGPEGETEDYPKEVVVGEVVRVTLGIINHEGEPVTYRVEVSIDGEESNGVVPVMLDDEEEWEGIATFTPDRTGDNQKVEFVLYKDGEIKPSLKLRLWIDVVARG